MNRAIARAAARQCSTARPRLDARGGVFTPSPTITTVRPCPWCSRPASDWPRPPPITARGVGEGAAATADELAVQRGPRASTMADWASFLVAKPRRWRLPPGRISTRTAAPCSSTSTTSRWSARSSTKQVKEDGGRASVTVDVAKILGRAEAPAVMNIMLKDDGALNGYRNVRGGSRLLRPARRPGGRSDCGPSPSGATRSPCALANRAQAGELAVSAAALLVLAVASAMAATWRRRRA